MFLLKKIVGMLCMPLSVAGVLLIAGLVLLWFEKGRKPAGVLLLLGTMTAMGFALSPVADRLLAPLERRYEPVTSIRGLEDVKFVVVLGGGNRSDPRLAATMQLTGTSLARLVEGIRLHRQLPESVLVFTGGAVFDAFPHARIMGEAAGELGEKEPMILLDQPRDTAEEMLALREVIAADEPFLLVTSASHMPRSVALAKAAGLAPIPAPTDFLVKQSLEWERNPGAFFPSAAALRRSERAVYEYLGLVWAQVREVLRLRRVVAKTKDG